MFDIFYFYCCRKIQTSWYDEEENKLEIFEVNFNKLEKIWKL